MFVLVELKDNVRIASDRFNLKIIDAVRDEIDRKLANKKPGEFIVDFPRAYTSRLATSYLVPESMYFATMSWLDLIKDDFRDTLENCEPALFSQEQLLFALGY